MCGEQELSKPETHSAGSRRGQAGSCGHLRSSRGTCEGGLCDCGVGGNVDRRGGRGAILHSAVDPSAVVSMLWQ